MEETKLLYLDDAYKKEFEATVIDIIEISNASEDPSIRDSAKTIYVVLDQTLFYPKGGGQGSDTGVITDNRQSAQYLVLDVSKREGRILHHVDKHGLKKGDVIHGMIDWERRYTFMRMHTAGHLIDAVLYKDGKILVTGNELGIDKSRIDFNMPQFTMEKVQEYIADANRIIEKDLAVKTYYMTREEAFKIPGIIKLAGALPPDIPVLRITEIVGLDIQADGGTHVNSLKEIGKINILSIENKGKERKRICYTLQR